MACKRDKHVVLLALATILLSQCSAQLVNTHVKRIVDASGGVAVSRSTITMKNEGNTDVDSFDLIIHPTEADNVMDLWVSDSSKDAYVALGIEQKPNSASADVASKTYRVKLPAPLKPGKEATVDVRMDLKAAITPVPAEISGHETQYMRYRGNAYFYSPYKTASVESAVVLGSSSVTSQNNVPSPSKLNGKRFTFGPYKNIASKSYQEVSLRFRNDRGFLLARRVLKEVGVTHWTTTSVREEYEIYNGAAKHTGEWSRLDHSQRYESPYGTAIGDVWANLEPGATDVFYEDLIGNITTSRLRNPTKEKRAVQLIFRYPMMGGWKNHFWILYKVPCCNEPVKHVSKQIAMTSVGSEHEIRVPLFPSVNVDLACDELSLRVLLPEWADDVRVDKHPSLKFDVEHSTERTSLTVLGRRTVTLKLRGIRSQSKHDNEVVIRYRYNAAMKWVSPVAYAVTLLIVVAMSLGALRTGLENAGISEWPAEQKRKTS